MCATDMDVVLQLNRYRMFYEKAGFPVVRMIIQVTPRDGGTYIALNRGVMDNIYMIEIPRLPDETVSAYFDEKAAALVQAMETGSMPEVCNQHERWEDDHKCKNFCSVRHKCPHGLQYLEQPCA